MTPLELFPSGMDTMAIAKRLRVEEAEIYNAIHRERSAEARKIRMGTYVPPKKTVSSAPRLIRYAGYDRRERL